MGTQRSRVGLLSVGVLVLATVVWYVGAIAATSLAAVFLIALYWPTAFSRVQRRQRRETAQRRKRREMRELKLEQAGVPRSELEDLTDLVETVFREAPYAARAARLEDLLDACADVEIAKIAYACHLVRAPEPICDTTPPLQRAVRARAVAWHATYAARVSACEDRAGELAELVRLYAQRALAPEVDHVFDDDLVSRQLTTLDESEPLQ